MAIEVSKEGISRAGQELLSSSNTLYNLFDELTEITNSIGTNLTGFPQCEELIETLNKVNSTRENIKYAIDEFGNYLVNTIAPGYDAFMNALSAVAEGSEVNARVE